MATDNNAGDGLSGALPPEVPDVFADSVNFAIGTYGVQIIFGIVEGDPTTPRPVASIRLSPQLALVLTQMLRKNLITYEEQIGRINLPDALFQTLEIEREL